MKAGNTANTEDLLLHAGWLRRFAVALVKDLDAAEDIVQETLVSAWQRPAENAGRPWLARVARNLAIDFWRSSDRRERRESAAAADVGTVASPEELIGDAQIHRAVAEAVAALEEPFRQTLVLRFFHGFSSAEIARHLHIPGGTVRWRLKEGIDRVRRSLDSRYGQMRKNWVAALLPLLTGPAPWNPGKVYPRPRLVRKGIAGTSPVTIVTASVFAVGLLVMVHTALSRHDPGAHPALPVAEVPAAGRAVSNAERTVRLNLQALASTARETEPPTKPGPGEADASSLLEELLQAVAADAYDDCVAKGSASFKAALRPAMFHRLSTTLGKRLAAGYQPTRLGRLHRGEGELWLFRLEFADGGDDALISMLTDGWQVAGFLIDDPQTNPKGK